MRQVARSLFYNEINYNQSNIIKLLTKIQKKAPFFSSTINHNTHKLPAFRHSLKAVMASVSQKVIYLRLYSIHLSLLLVVTSCFCNNQLQYTGPCMLGLVQPYKSVIFIFIGSLLLIVRNAAQFGVHASEQEGLLDPNH